MSYEEELINHTIEYEKIILDILIKVVNDKVKFSKENNYDDIDTFLCVEKGLEDIYDGISSFLGTEESSDGLWLVRYFPSVEYELDKYLESYVEKAMNQLKFFVNKILMSSSYHELVVKYNEVQEYISKKGLFKYDFLLDGLEFDSSLVHGLELKTKS